MSNVTPSVGGALLLATKLKVASGSTKRRIAHAVAIRSTWIRSLVTNSIALTLKLRMPVGHGLQLAADPLLEGQTPVDGRGRFISTGGGEVVSLADLVELALKSHQLLL